MEYQEAAWQRRAVVALEAESCHRRAELAADFLALSVETLVSNYARLGVEEERPHLVKPGICVAIHPGSWGCRRLRREAE